MKGLLFWCAVRVRTGFENIVAAKFAAEGLEAFLPKLPSRRRSDCGKTSETPLFPNYVFFRIHPEARLDVLMTPGVMSLVGGTVATPVNEAEIAAIKAVVLSGLPYKPCPFVNTGQRVVIADGPLQNLEGVLIKPEGDYRIAFGVSLLERSVLVDLETGTQIVHAQRAQAASQQPPGLLRAGRSPM